MAIIVIGVSFNEYEYIRELINEHQQGVIGDESFKDGLMKIIGEAMPREATKDDEIRLVIEKTSKIGWTKGSNFAN